MENMHTDVSVQKKFTDLVIQELHKICLEFFLFCSYPLKSKLLNKVVKFRNNYLNSSLDDFV